MEQAFQKQTVKGRSQELLKLIGQLDQNKLMEYLDGQIQMAYTAGINGLSLDSLPAKGLRDIGEYSVLARNYSHDKGYR